MNHSKQVLPIIVLSQFCCTALWFAGNGVMSDLIAAFQLTVSALGHLTAAVQFGFITGTLVFAVLTIADRFSPSLVFLTSALAGAFFNVMTIWESNTLTTLLVLRFMTGFFLAGIYPIGMKIAADYYQKGLGKSLGFLVGALVVGTAFPHLLKGFGMALPWRMILILISGLAATGGILMWLFVPNGPFRKRSQQPDFTAMFKVFKNAHFRAAAFGYFGHMWELYAFWAFVPLMLASYMNLHPTVDFDIPVLSFLIIGLGGLACVTGGYLAEYFGTKRIAFWALLCSGICCVLSPLMFYQDSAMLMLIFLVFWGLAVIADSPLFSTLVAQNALPEIKGTALTIVTCIGFFVTIISIQLISFLMENFSSIYIYTVLVIGPIFGLGALMGSKE